MSRFAFFRAATHTCWLLAAAVLAIGFVGACPSRAQTLTASDYTTYFQWDADRRPVMKIGPDPDGSSGSLKRRAEKTTYDAEGRVVRVDVGTVDSVSVSSGIVSYTNFVVGQTTQARYDPVGNKTQLYGFPGTAAATLTQVSYDADDRPLCTAVRMNSAAFDSLYSASTSPNACALTTAGSLGNDRISKTIYDAVGQTLQTIQALGSVDQRTYATYTYTLNGKQQTLTDANGNKSTLIYDGFDRLVQQNFPSTTRGAGTSSTTDFEQYSYDLNGNRIGWRLRDGSIIDYAFDALNRMTGKSGARVPGVTYAYDLAGRPTATLFSASGTGVTYSYDTAGRQVTETTNGRTLTYAYDKAGNRTRLTWPDGGYIVNTVDAASHLTAVALTSNSPFVTYGFDNLGRRVSASNIFNATGTSWGFDAANRLTSLVHDLPGAGQDVTFGFGYNPAGQTVSQTVSNSAYVWAAPSTSLAATADGLNRDAAIVAIGGGDCGVSGKGYDCNGNITNDGAGRTFSYDGENRLTTMTGPASASLEYDPLGRLYQTTINGTVTQFLYAGDKLVAEYAVSGAVQRRYVPGYGVDEAILWWEGSGYSDPRSLHADRQGSVIAASNSAAASIYTYGPYGESGDNWGAGSRFRYTGQIALPELKLYHYKARAYDPARGWFLQTDPIGYRADLNLYAYTGGDPVNRSDPTGEVDIMGNSTGPDDPDLGGAVSDEARREGNEIVGEVVGKALEGIGLRTGHPELVLLGRTVRTVTRRGDTPAPRTTARRNPDGVTFTDATGRVRTPTTTTGPGAGARIPKGARAAERAASNDTCIYCGTKTTNEPGHSNSSQGDHIAPANPRGGGDRGSNKPENVANACATCNVSKSNKDVLDWIAERFGQ